MPYTGPADYRQFHYSIKKKQENDAKKKEEAEAAAANVKAKKSVSFEEK